VSRALARWPRARLFRLIFAQSTDGWWDVTETVAFALEARTTEELAELRPGAWERAKDWVLEMLGRTAELLTESDDAGDVARRGFDSGMSQDFGDASEVASPGAHALAKEAAAAAGDATDDPLLCSPAALLNSLPARVAALHGRGEGDVNAKRVWATLCCIAFLETLNVSWLWTDGNLYPEVEHTIIDAGREWLAGYAAERPALAEALEDGAVERAAQRAVRLWHRAWDARVNELRRSDAITAKRALSQAHHACTDIMRAFTMRHATLSVFLSEPLDGLQRWQMFIVIVTLVIEQLLINIWMCVCVCARLGHACRFPARFR
jgi:hypothetical protein